MALSWNEIKERAVKFSREWEDAFNEEADAKPFLVDFFNVFGISRRRVASFEYRIKKLDNHDGYIDLLWKGNLLIEMKSRGKSLDKAYQQAIDYLPGLKQHELPRFILVSDFENFRLYDFDEDRQHDFKLNDLVNHVHLFGFIVGYQKRSFKDEDAVNIQAAERMGKLHDALKESGYSGHDLEKYLVRLLFCLFADDTTIFEPGIFQEYILNKTNEDGTDLGIHLAHIFQVLNTPEDKRQKNLDESLTLFPYVNGDLFAEQLSFASFNSKMRQSLLECCALDWGKISPAIFGSMFQSVMDKTARRNLGAHYTSEKNILKLIKPLFLDNLWKEFETLKTNPNKLRAFHRKIASLRFLDPACGCGNFLVITYRELRLLELTVLKVLQKGQQVIDLNSLILCNVDRFYGIEYEEFPTQIAQVALWLMDHQMNMVASLEFGEYFRRLPLQKSATIIHGNALQIGWNDLIKNQPIEYVANDTIVTLNDPEIEYTVNIKTKNLTIIDERKQEIVKPYVKPGFDYILGNPPFVGKSLQNSQQKADMEKIFSGVKGAGVLDYVSAWYVKAAQLIQNTNIKAAFVSTNSISQGEQVGVLWNLLYNHYKIKIHFAHRTFKWGNEARGNAAVHVVIIGFANFDVTEKQIFEYDDIKGEPNEVKVENINPYLVEGKDFALLSRTNPLCDCPNMMYGNKIVDGGHYLFTDSEKEDFLKKEPLAQKYFKPILSGDEYINGKNRWILYLAEADPNELRNMPFVKQRIENVAKFRAASPKIKTRETAKNPTVFSEPRQPKNDFLLIPRTSSENRRYLPLGFFTKNFIVNDSCIALPDATLFHFAILTSEMHMTWVKYVCGRLKSDFRYSNSIVYNNFPWPENPTEKQKEAIEKASQKVLDARAAFPARSLADLYDPLTMPSALVKAHNELDKAVDLAYRSQPFISDTKRIEFLFELYDKYTSGLFATEKKKGKKPKIQSGV